MKYFIQKLRFKGKVASLEKRLIKLIGNKYIAITRDIANGVASERKLYASKEDWIEGKSPEISIIDYKNGQYKILFGENSLHSILSRAI